MPRINVRFSNTFGNEATVTVPVSEGTSVEDFLNTQGGIPENAVVRVNRQTVGLEDELAEGDVVSLVPTQIKGA